MKKVIGWVLLLIFLVIIILMFNFFQKSSEPQVLGVRDFSCDTLRGFSFKYPIFKGLESVRVNSLENKDVCSLSIGKDDNYILLSLSLEVVDIKNANEILEKNPNGVDYYKKRGLVIQEENLCFRMSGEKEVCMRVFGLSKVGMDEKDELKLGFSREKFWQTVIESFRLN